MSDDTPALPAIRIEAVLRCLCHLVGVPPVGEAGVVGLITP